MPGTLSELCLGYTPFSGDLLRDIEVRGPH